MQKKKNYKIIWGVLIFLVLLLIIYFQFISKWGTNASRKQLSTEQKIAGADLIVTGNVFAVIPGPTGADVLINVDQVYKGTVPERGITIAALDAEKMNEERSIDGTDLHFASGQPPYLLYLHEREDDRYHTSRCDGSRFLGEGLSSEEQQFLGSE